MTRFAPAWVLYTIAELLVILTLYSDYGDPRYLAADMGDSLMALPVINLCYALLVGQLLFGDLYNSRMCNALHAMPMRREGWFLANILSGLAFSLLPNAIGALLASVLLGSYWYMAFVWFLAVTLQYLFFFGAAVFSAYSVGNRFAMALMYGLINFLSLLAYWLVCTFYESALYGMVIPEEPFCLLCPVVSMSQTEYFSWLSDGVRNTILQVNWAAFLYSTACAVVGFLLMGAALLFYRRRQLECASDFIAVKPLAPVFLVVYTLCAGAVLYLFYGLFIGDENLIFMFIGVIIGFFTGKMLLDRTLRVFHKKTFLGMGTFALVFTLSILLARIDPIGITRWVPKAEQVERVTLSNYYSANYYAYNAQRVTLTDPADITDILQVHQHAVENRQEESNSKADVKIYLSYQLKSGVTAQRYYYIDTDTEAGQTLCSYLSRPEYVLGISSEQLNKGIDMQFLYLESDYLTEPAHGSALFQAMLLDCEAGNMAQYSAFHSDDTAELWLEYGIETYDGNFVYRLVTIYSSCENTLTWLEEHGYLEDNYE